MSGHVCRCAERRADPRTTPGLRCAWAAVCAAMLDEQVAQPGYAAPDVGATAGERKVIEATAALARAWGELERTEGVSHPSHGPDVARAIHDVQRVVAIRVARRVNPELWRPSDE